MRLWWLAGLLAMASCGGGTSCDRWATKAQECFDTYTVLAGGDLGTSLPTCAPTDSEAVLACEIDAWDLGNCTTEDGYQATLRSVSACGTAGTDTDPADDTDAGGGADPATTLCREYVALYEDCIEDISALFPEAPIDGLPTDYCDAWTGQATAVPYLECLIDFWGGVECRDPLTFLAEGSQALEDCPPPG